MVADRENSALAARLIEQTCLKQGIEPHTLTLHSDRGAPMTSKCTARLLADLGVTRSLSRPQVSDDNPFSEAQLKTLKYHPDFPGRFEDITTATDFCRSFFPWYNTEHRHAGISMLTPQDVHYGPSRPRPGATRTYPSLRLGPAPRTIRARNPEAPASSPRGLDQPAGPGLDASACSVNPNRRCLNVVDRFRSGLIGRITLEVKCAGARSAGNPHAACDVAGAGDGATVGPTWARRGKPRIRTRVHPDGQPRQLSTLPFYCTRNRKGNFKVGYRTEKSRLLRSIAHLTDLMRRQRHLPVREQALNLRRVLRGHYAYYGIAGNFRALQKVQRFVERYWRKMLSSRSRAGYVTWEAFVRITTCHPLPRPKLALSYGELQRCAVL